MYKATLSLAILAVARLALANPYCLLTAVNKFEHPADQKNLCCKEADKVESYLEELCPSNLQSDAKDAFKTACKEAGFDDCSKDHSSSSSSESSSKTQSGGSHSSSAAPYPVTYTTVYFDEDCTCSKTTTATSTSLPGSSGFATGTAPVATGTSPASPGGNGGSGAGSGPGATGSPIAPVSPSKTGSGTAPTFTGAASKKAGSAAAGLLAVAGIALVL